MMTYKQLNYSTNSLEPYISAETMEYHWEKHYKGYVDTYNSLIQKDIVNKEVLKNQFNQIKNHELFFDNLTPYQKNIPTNLKSLLERDFNSILEFKQKFEDIASSVFGSGYVWLCIDFDGRLIIEKTSNATQPEHKILLVCDLWEHSYYLDHRNRRNDWIKNFWKVVDWDVVTERLLL